MLENLDLPRPDSSNRDDPSLTKEGKKRIVIPAKAGIHSLRQELDATVLLSDSSSVGQEGGFSFPIATHLSPKASLRDNMGSVTRRHAISFLGRWRRIE